MPPVEDAEMFDAPQERPVAVSAVSDPSPPSPPVSIPQVPLEEATSSGDVIRPRPDELSTVIARPGSSQSQIESQKAVRKTPTSSSKAATTATKPQVAKPVFKPPSNVPKAPVAPKPSSNVPKAPVAPKERVVALLSSKSSAPAVVDPLSSILQELDQGFTALTSGGTLNRVQESSRLPEVPARIVDNRMVKSTGEKTVDGQITASVNSVGVGDARRQAGVTSDGVDRFVGDQNTDVNQQPSRSGTPGQSNAVRDVNQPIQGSQTQSSLDPSASTTSPGVGTVVRPQNRFSSTMTTNGNGRSFQRPPARFPSTGLANSGARPLLRQRMPVDSFYSRDRLDFAVPNGAQQNGSADRWAGRREEQVQGPTRKPDEGPSPSRQRDVEDFSFVQPNVPKRRRQEEPGVDVRGREKDAQQNGFRGSIPSGSSWSQHAGPAPNLPRQELLPFPSNTVNPSVNPVPPVLPLPVFSPPFGPLPDHFNPTPPPFLPFGAPSPGFPVGGPVAQFSAPAVTMFHDFHPGERKPDVDVGQPDAFTWDASFAERIELKRAQMKKEREELARQRRMNNRRNDRR